MIFSQALINIWAPAMALLFMISITINTVLYLLGTFLQNDKIKAAVRNGFVEIFYSAIILSIAVFGFEFTNDLVKGLASDNNGHFMVTIEGHKTLGGNCYQQVDLCQETDTFLASNPSSPYYYNPATNEGIKYCHIRVSMYLLNTLFNELDDYAFKIYQSYMFSSTMADFALNVELVSEKAGFFTMTPQRGFFVMPNMIKTFAFETAIKLMTLLKFQEILLSFVSQSLFPGLFIVGIVMRTFAFTRRTGGLIMAIALVLFFVFPMFYVLPALIVKSIKENLRGVPGLDNPDPKIADYITISSSVPILGNPNNVDLQKESEKYRDTKCHNSGLAQVSAGNVFDSGSPYSKLPHIGTIDVKPDALNADQVNKLKEASASWYKKVSQTNWYDPDFVGYSFEYGGIIEELSRLAFFAVFFGLMGVIGSIAAIRSLSMVLGGDIEIAGLTHLI